MALYDWFELKMSGNLLGQTILNFFNYRAQNGLATALTTGTAFRDTVIPFITPVVVDIYTITEIEVRNINTPTDYWIDTFSAPGQRAVSCDSTFPAWGFTKNLERPDRHSGGIRIAGVPNDAMVNGYPTGFYAPRLDSLANVFGNYMVNAGGISELGVISTRCVKDADNHCTDTFYPPEFVAVNNVTFDWYTSQNTRKPGRGA